MSTNSLYYIMDYSSNYYRVNKEDQLVVAANEEEATVFTFAQGNSRICVGKKSSFYCMIPIEAEGEVEMSYEISKERMPEIETDAVIEQNETREHISSVKELTYNEIQEPIKELRLERKTKSQELNCLYALTEYIDCNALADTCEGNLAEIEEILNVKDESVVITTQIAGNEAEQIHVVEPLQNMVG